MCEFYMTRLADEETAADSGYVCVNGLSDEESLSTYSDDGLDDFDLDDHVLSLPTSKFVSSAKQIDLKETISTIHVLMDAPDKSIALIQTESHCHWLQWDKIKKCISSQGL